MSTRKEIAKAKSELWKMFNGNPSQLISIIERNDRLERHKDWFYEDELPKGYDYEANYFRSEVRDGVRMFPRESQG